MTTTQVVKRQSLSTTVLFRITLIRTIDAELTCEIHICWQSKQTSYEQLIHRFQKEMEVLRRQGFVALGK